MQVNNNSWGEFFKDWNPVGMRAYTLTKAQEIDPSITFDHIKQIRQQLTDNLDLREIKVILATKALPYTLHLKPGGKVVLHHSSQYGSKKAWPANTHFEISKREAKWVSSNSPPMQRAKKVDKRLDILASDQNFTFKKRLKVATTLGKQIQAGHNKGQLVGVVRPDTLFLTGKGEMVSTAGGDFTTGKDERLWNNENFDYLPDEAYTSVDRHPDLNRRYRNLEWKPNERSDLYAFGKTLEALLQLNKLDPKTQQSDGVQELKVVLKDLTSSIPTERELDVAIRTLERVTKSL